MNPVPTRFYTDIEAAERDRDKYTELGWKGPDGAGPMTCKFYHDGHEGFVIECEEEMYVRIDGFVGPYHNPQFIHNDQK